MGRGFKKLIREHIDPELAYVLRKYKATEKYINNAYKAFKEYQRDTARQLNVSMNSKQLLKEMRIIIIRHAEKVYSTVSIQYCGFYWRTTPEGYQFWKDIDYALLERVTQVM